MGGDPRLSRLPHASQSAGRTIEHGTLLTHDAALKVEDAEAKMEELFQFWDQARAAGGGLAVVWTRGSGGRTVAASAMHGW